jgi:uncharacterized protein (TIGR02266 family)
MAEERRSARRVRLSGVRVTYESASGERVEADALDLGGGGVFVRTASPLAVGKRIALEIQVIGERDPWAAIGRVVWTRARGEGEKAPPGMGVKLIDADDAVIAAIARLVDTRERTEPGVGKPPSLPDAAPVAAAGPEPERTLKGVGASEEAIPATGAAPPGHLQPSTPREASVPREPSVAIDLVSRKPAPPRAPADKGGGAGRWIVMVLLLVVAGVAAYVLLDGFLRPPGR